MTYDSAGRVLTTVDPRGNEPGADPADYTTTFTYDDADRLLTATDPRGHVTTNTYDADGIATQRNVFPGVPGEVLVTFLWRGTRDTHSVRVLSDDVLPGTPADNAMTRLGASDVWYKTYQPPADFRFEYLLAPNDPALGSEPAEAAQATYATWQPDPLNPRQFLIPDHGDHPEWEEAFSWSTWVRRVNSLVELPAAPRQPLIKPPAAAS